MIGIGVVGTKRYIASELTDLLDELVRESTGCLFKKDSLSISLMTLTASAYNARIVCGQKRVLGFEELYASVSLSKIRERQIILSHFILNNGIADGFSPESPTFKFIEFLSTSKKESQTEPQEDKSSDRWQLRLDKLTMNNSTFTESFGDTKVTAQKVNLEVTRTPKDKFLLVPTIGRIVLKKKGNDSFSLGKTQVTLGLHDGETSIKKGSIRKRGSRLNVSGSINYEDETKIDLNSDFKINPNSFGLEDLKSLVLLGQGKVSGDLKKIKATGSFENKDDTSASLFNDSLIFSEIEGQYEIEVTDEKLKVKAVGNAWSDNSSFEISEPLILEEDRISGVITGSAKNITIGGIDAKGVNVNIKVGATIDDPSVEISGFAQGVGVTGRYIQDITFNATHKKSSLLIKASNSDKTLSTEGEIFSKSDGTTVFKNLSISGQKVPLWSTNTLGKPIPTPFLLTLNGALTGQAELTKLLANFELDLALIETPQSSVLSGKGSLKDGKFTLAVNNSKKSLSVLYYGDLKEGSGSLSVDAVNFSLNDIEPSNACSLIDGSLDYRQEKQAKDSSGILKLNKLSFGCQTYTLEMPSPQEFRITNGETHLSKFILRGLDSNLVIDGHISTSEGITLSANGTIELNALLPLIPAVDDVRGRMDIDLLATGDLLSPSLTGKASLNNGEVLIQSADLSVVKLNGALTLDKGKISIPNLTGEINGGELILTGDLDPANSEDSLLNIKLSNSEFSPIKNSFLLASSDLNLTGSIKNGFSLNGEIIINKGEIERNITLRTLIQSLTLGLTSAESLTGSSKNKLLSSIALDIALKAPNNLFLIANWAEAELSCNFHIYGSLADPEVNGELSALSGWFGFRQRRFSISSATLGVTSLTSEPFIDIIAETQVPSTTGESTLIMLEAKGPISSPQVSFTSDIGLSEKEIASLITRSGFELSQSVLDDLSSPFGLTDLEKERPLFGKFYSVIKSVTDIDSLSVEPSYNDQTGTLNPIIIAEKNLSNKLKLIGRNSFSSGRQESAILGHYQIKPDLAFITGLENLPLEEVVAYSADLSYTVLSSKIPFVTIKLNGNKAISKQKILEILRIDPDSRITQHNLNSLGQELLSYYHDLGYLSCSVNISCSDDGEFCREISIKIDEEEPSKINNLLFLGDDISEYLKLVDLPKKDSVATQKTLTELTSSLQRLLRSDGYIQARLHAEYETLPQNKKVNLRLTTTLESPVTFMFTGNSKFSADDFLSTINLFGRKQPFGRNTIFILLENIEVLYRQVGHLYATTAHTENQDIETGRITYSITIDEGPVIHVRKVTISGTSSLSKKKLISRIGRKDVDLTDRFLNPKYAISKEIEYFKEAIADIYRREGFPEISVQSKISSSKKRNVSIEYIIIEGPRVSTNKLKMNGMPSTIQLPTLPEAPYSINKINKYIGNLISLIRESGFANATLSTGAFNQDEFNIDIDPGEQTHIGQISVVGISQISKQIVLENLTVSPGSVWNQKELEKSKRNLFQLGLFSRVQIEPTDGAYDDPIEALTIKVLERSLRSLDLGIGANSEYGLHTFGEFIDRKLFSDGRSVGLRVDTYYDRDSSEISKGVASLRYTDPFFLEKDLRLTEDLRFQRLKNGVLPFDLDRVALSSFVDKNINEQTSFTIGHTLSQEDLSNVEPDVILTDLDSGILNLSFLSGSLNFDHRDSAIVPRKGFFLGLDSKLASNGIGSEANYVGGGVKFSFYQPLHFAKQFTIANNVKFFGLLPFADTEEIPISQRLFIGGHNTIRGFRENSVGPKGDLGNSLGGDYLFQNNFELLYNYDDSIQIAGFLDIGSVFLQSRAASIEDLREGAGIATRYLSPIGAISLDLGFPLDEREGEPSIRLYFNIGSQF